MEVSDKKIKEITRRIMISRMRILINNGFYGLLLMHMKISLSDRFETAWTDCKENIFINPEFADAISDMELDYVLMHEIVHAALQHSQRRGDFNPDIFDKAADIVVNSNIMHSNGDNEDTISVESYGGVQPHTAPDGSEGYNYSVEELYMLLLVETNENENKHDAGDVSKSPNGDRFHPENNDGNKYTTDKYGGWDEHPSDDEPDTEQVNNKLLWEGNVKQAAEAMANRNQEKTRGLLPAFAERYIMDLKKPQVDWRQLLVEFIQDEINDYSFLPPDRRMEDSPFFLPDFNERDEKPGKILFAVDTSGSMSDREITACYSEIKGAIDQFDGKISGWLSFFDAVFTEPVPFTDVEELLSIIPRGGGGTSFGVIFDYLESIDEEELPQSIVILTDGYAPFPKEERALGIPVLWIINNEDRTPTWGKVARIVVERS